MARVMIDTSSWTHALRRGGDEHVRLRVQGLLDSGSAAWCDMVRLELWNGVRDDVERRNLGKLDPMLLNLPISPRVWQKASDVASAARGAGLTAPAADILIFSCAKYHGVAIEHSDRHYSLLEKLPIF